MSVFWLPTNALQLPCPWKERSTEEYWGSGYHDRSMVDATVLGVFSFCEAFSFLTNSSTS